MNVIKRDGSEAIFDAQKIYNAILGVNNDLEDVEKIDGEAIQRMTDNVVQVCGTFKRTLSVEEIQDIVEKVLMTAGRHEAACAFIYIWRQHFNSHSLTG